MKTQGFGDIKPAARTLSLVGVTIPMGCQKNRRVEITLRKRRPGIRHSHPKGPLV
jgi:outer membrane protein OmpA-like peptidoglycan-associated protein